MLVSLSLSPIKPFVGFCDEGFLQDFIVESQMSPFSFYFLNGFFLFPLVLFAWRCYFDARENANDRRLGHLLKWWLG